MRKLLILLTLFGVLWAAVPSADARHYRRSVRYYDGCDYYPSYRRVYRDYGYRNYYGYRRPVRYYRYHDDYYYPRYYRRAPRFSFSVGF